MKSEGTINALQFNYIIGLTSAISETHFWKAPHIAKSHGITKAGKNEFKLIAPMST